MLTQNLLTFGSNVCLQLYSHYSTNWSRLKNYEKSGWHYLYFIQLCSNLPFFTPRCQSFTILNILLSLWETILTGDPIWAIYPLATRLPLLDTYAVGIWGCCYVRGPASLKFDIKFPNHFLHPFYFWIHKKIATCWSAIFLINPSPWHMLQI